VAQHCKHVDHASVLHLMALKFANQNLQKLLVACWLAARAQILDFMVEALSEIYEFGGIGRLI